MILRAPLSCRRTALWLLAASLLSVLVWYATLGVWFAISGKPIMPRSVVEPLSWITLVGVTVFTYALILRRSKWLFDLPTKPKWVAAITIAIVLTLGFIMFFDIAWTIYAGW
jgi:hypothetical protein